MGDAGSGSGPEWDEIPTAIRDALADPSLRKAFEAAERSALVRLNREAIERAEEDVFRTRITLPSVALGKERSVVLGGGAMQLRTLIALVMLAIGALYALPADIRAPIVAAALVWITPAEESRSSGPERSGSSSDAQTPAPG